MRNATRRVFVGSLLAAVLGGDLSLAETPRSVTDIYRIWKQRETKIRSASFSWKQTARNKPRTNEGGDVAAPKPGQFIEVVQRCAVRLDDNRLDFRLDTLNAERFGRPVGYRTTFDGQLSWNYSGTVKADGHGSGTVVK